MRYAAASGCEQSLTTMALRGVFLLEKQLLCNHNRASVLIVSCGGNTAHVLHDYAMICNRAATSEPIWHL
jgi:hypothetical protein